MALQDFEASLLSVSRDHAHPMKKITTETYRNDKYYPKVVRAAEAILATGEVVAPIDVFVHLEVLSKADVESWRFGRVPYLERVIRGSLGKTSRILRILRMHAHDLNLRPSQTAYVKWGKGKRTPLRFSKTGDPNLEEAYSRHFLKPGLTSKKRRPSEQPALEGEASPAAEPNASALEEHTERGASELVSATLAPNDQLWFHHPEMLARVARAEQEFAEGRSTRTKTPDEAQALLDSLKQRTGR